MLEFYPLNFDNVGQVALLEKQCFGKNAWSENLLIEEIPQKNKHYFVCVENNKVLGYGGFAQILDEGHIMNIAVDCNYRKQGIATKILNNIIGLSSDLGIKSYTLEVREKNIPARNLYEQQKFICAGIRKSYYSDGENACIYWRVL
ncbi:MAG: ribosomal protein S18-alanine N-acetyltransferase [Clostridia bacterium]